MKNSQYNLSFKKITLYPAPRNDSTKIAKRIEWVEEKSKADMDYLENCIFVDESGFDSNMRHANSWQILISDELLKTNDFFEGDLLHTLWTFVYRAFKKSEVKAKLGERSSVSSALGRNEGRSLEFRERRERK